MHRLRAMTCLGRLTGLFLLCGWTRGCSHAIAYRFVNTISGTESSPALALPAENALRGALDTESLESAVRRRASIRLVLRRVVVRGRTRHTRGNAEISAGENSRIVKRNQPCGLTA